MAEMSLGHATPGEGMQKIPEDAEHKSCYDTELITTEHIRNLKVKESDELTSESEKYTAEVRQLVAEIAALGEETAVPQPHCSN